MCDPLTMTQLALAAGGAIQGNIQANQAADIAGRSFKRNEAAATVSAGLQYRGISERTLEEREALEAELRRVVTESTKAVGTAVVASAEGGVGGQSVAALLDQYRVDAARAIDDRQTGQKNRDRQAELDRINVETARRGRVLSGAQALPARPGFLGTALQIGTSVAGVVSQNSYYDSTTQTRRLY